MCLRRGLQPENPENQLEYPERLGRSSWKSGLASWKWSGWGDTTCPVDVAL